MSTVDDLMALVDDYCIDPQDQAWKLRTALEAALRAEYERGRSERERNAEPAAWRPAFKFTNPAMEAGRTWSGGKPSEADIVYWTKHGAGIEYAYVSPPNRKPLTVEQIDSLADKCLPAVDMRRALGRLFARAVERAHGIGDG